MKITLQVKIKCCWRVKMECCLGSKLGASTQSQCLCGFFQFGPLVHFILTPGSTLFWTPSSPFLPPGLIFKTEKSYKSQFKKGFRIFEIVIYLIIFLRIYSKKLFITLGIPLKKLKALWYMPISTVVTIFLFYKSKTCMLIYWVLSRQMLAPCTLHIPHCILTLHAHCTDIHCTALHCTALHCNALYCTALTSTVLHCTALSSTALHCTHIHCTALHCTHIHCTALQCTALQCTAWISLNRIFLNNMEAQDLRQFFSKNRPLGLIIS